MSDLINDTHHFIELVVGSNGSGKTSYALTDHESYKYHVFLPSTLYTHHTNTSKILTLQKISNILIHDKYLVLSKLLPLAIKCKLTIREMLQYEDGNNILLCGKKYSFEEDSAATTTEKKSLLCSDNNKCIEELFPINTASLHTVGFIALIVIIKNTLISDPYCKVKIAIDSIGSDLDDAYVRNLFRFIDQAIDPDEKKRTLISFITHDQRVINNCCLYVLQNSNINGYVRYFDGGKHCDKNIRDLVTVNHINRRWLACLTADKSIFVEGPTDVDYISGIHDDMGAIISLNGASNALLILDLVNFVNTFGTRTIILLDKDVTVKCADTFNKVKSNKFVKLFGFGDLNNPEDYVIQKINNLSALDNGLGGLATNYMKKPDHDMLKSALSASMPLRNLLIEYIMSDSSDAVTYRLWYEIPRDFNKNEADLCP